MTVTWEEPEEKSIADQDSIDITADDLEMPFSSLRSPPCSNKPRILPWGGISVIRGGIPTCCNLDNNNNNDNHASHRSFDTAFSRASRFAAFFSRHKNGAGETESVTNSKYASFLDLAMVSNLSSNKEKMAPVVLVAMLVGTCYALPAVLVHSDIFQPISPEIKFQLYVSGLSAVPIAMFLKWAIWQMTAAFKMKMAATDVSVKDSFKTANTILEEEEEKKDSSKVNWYTLLVMPDQTSSLFFLTIVMYHLVLLSKVVVNEELEVVTERLLNTGLAFSIFAAWNSMLDDLHAFVTGYADDLDSIAKESLKTSKMVSIMKDFSRFKDHATDCGYAIPGGSRSPARVLAEITGVYCNIAKLTGFVLLFLFFVGVDIQSNLVILGLAVSMAGLIQALHINEALGNVLPLALSNIFHVGEIISIARTGFQPGDLPETSLTGFVEGVTWSHVVLRDFRKKQTFVPHSEMEKTNIANWTRRPAKLCHFQLAVAPGLSGGAAPLAQLAKFVLSWIDRHPSIDQGGYKKSCIKLSATHGGPILEAIFYPSVGMKSRQLRSEFLVMVMDAAKRLDLCVTRAEVRTGTAWQDPSPARQQQMDDIDEQFSDLMPSTNLTLRAGFKPKVA